MVIAETAPLVVDVLCGTVRENGERVALAPAEAAVVFALATASRPVRREALIDLLYPRATLDAGSGALRVHIHRVRRRLGPTAIVRDERGLALDPRIRVEGLNTLREIRNSAVPLSRERRDDLLALRARMRRGRPAFMAQWAWFEATLRELENFERDLGLLLARDALAHGDPARAVALAEDALQLDPADDEAVVLAVRAAMMAGVPIQAAHMLHGYEAAVAGDAGVSSESIVERAVAG